MHSCRSNGMRPGVCFAFLYQIEPKSLKWRLVSANLDALMKKVFLTAGLLTALSAAASAAPYVLPTPQYGTLTSYDWQPTYQIEFLYGIASPAHTYSDIYGPRVSLNLYSDLESTFRHQWSINVASLWGSGHHDNVKRNEFMLPVTLGYDLNMALTDNILFYIDGKAGIAVGDIKWEDRQTGKRIAKESATDFTFLVGAGFKVIASDAIQIKAGYELQKAYFEDTMTLHVISIGVGVTF